MIRMKGEMEMMALAPVVMVEFPPRLRNHILHVSQKNNIFLAE